MSRVNVLYQDLSDFKDTHTVYMNTRSGLPDSKEIL